MKHSVSKELGIALDFAIEKFTVEGILDASKQFEKWDSKCEPLNHISTYQLARYIIEGYDYPKSVEQSIDLFMEWFKDYNKHVPLPTKNSSYRRGRRQTLEEIEKKLTEYKLFSQEDNHLQSI